MFKQKIPRLLIIVLTVLALSGITGCFKGKLQRKAPASVSGGYPLEITDSYQRRVTIAQEPRRIISLAPNITETLFALGKGRLLVGRTDYCNYPAAVRRVASVGSLQSPGIEKIVQLQPDLVIASTHFQKETLAKLEELGIKVVVLYGEESFNGVYETIRQVGRVVNTRKAAAQVVAAMQRKVKLVITQVKNRRRPGVYYVVSFGRTGDYTAGGDTFIGKMLEMAGGINVADDSRGWQYSVEQLVARNPEIVICSKYFKTKAALQQATGYRDLTAVKAGQLYEVDNNLLDRQGPRLADGLMALAKLIHPEIFKEADKE